VGEYSDIAWVIMQTLMFLGTLAQALEGILLKRVSLIGYIALGALTVVEKEWVIHKDEQPKLYYTLMMLVITGWLVVGYFLIRNLINFA
jgi:hypothetical protein